jgi:chromosome segregation ATPase
VSRLCAAAYQVGMNDTLESHLGEREAEVDALAAEAEAMNLELSASQEKLAQARLKLLAVDAKTEPARLAAKRLAQEIQLKQMDLSTRLEELGQLQADLEALKQKKGTKASLIEDLEKTKVQIRQAKADISSMNAYLEEDLLIRAENALQYD